jgi:hypothetical protein
MEQIYLLQIQEDPIFSKKTTVTLIMELNKAVGIKGSLLDLILQELNSNLDLFPECHNNLLKEFLLLQLVQQWQESKVLEDQV